jgi:NADP-dependent 3-hydroxy acid dehydrogenase YdfG
MKDKVIVITGASGGIGAALAELVAQKGARTVLLARREKALLEVAARLGNGALTLVTDVTRRADVESAVQATLSRYGHIDVWVNNAGRGITCPVSELTDADFDAMMSVNVKAALYGMQAVLPHFRERREGHIVNLSSMLGRMPFAVARSAYSAAKHALNSLTANFRMELAATTPNIHVSSIHPGVVATEFGTNALHGGMDSRQFPGAQTAQEVAAVIADVIERPRADVYTRPEAQSLVVKYYAAEDMGQAEQQPPFTSFPRKPGPATPTTSK